MDLYSFYRLRLSPESKKILEGKKEAGSTYVDTINTLIELFGTFPADIHQDLMSLAKSKALKLSKAIESSGKFASDSLHTSLNRYLAIIEYLNDGTPVSLEEIQTELDMTKTPLKNGYLVCPRNFVLINPDEAKNMETAYVIECRNASKYDIPHYIVFCHPKDPYETVEVYDDKLLNQLLRRVPKFQRIVDLQVAPIYDPEHPENILNEKEFMAAPTIGYFRVHTHGDPSKPADYKPPYGVQIIKDQ